MSWVCTSFMRCTVHPDHQLVHADNDSLRESSSRELPTDWQLSAHARGSWSRSPHKTYAVTVSLGRRVIYFPSCPDIAGFSLVIGGTRYTLRFGAWPVFACFEFRRRSFALNVGWHGRCTFQLFTTKLWLSFRVSAWNQSLN